MTRRSSPSTVSAASTCAASLALVIACSSAAAQDFPNRPVRMVVPFGAGGVSDIIGRTLASRMQEGLGQPIIVDNRGGAGGSIGSDIVAKAQPDGHTILLGSNGTHAIVPYLYKNLRYDPIKDFTPVAMIAITPTVLAVNPELPVKSVKELIAYARAKPGALSFGSSGIGSTSHLAGEMLGALGGVTLTHVPYKNASAAYPDVFAGRVPMIFDSVVSMTQHLKAGKLRPLAVTTPKRVATLPDLPTMAEAGLPGYAITLWIAMFGPGGMPPAITTRLNKEINRVLTLPEVRDQMAAQGSEVTPGAPADLLAAVKVDLKRMGEIVKAAKIQPE
ncbi:MAG: Bug family tripartite tricarboxylate transporter substrate binding protein [bacterium]|nr:tripartite tricarboxylate transporter substrate binding protein [Betaproteobacteria bacterium]